MTEESKGYRCEACQRSYDEAVPTYNFSFRFGDFSDSLYLSVLGESGDAVMGIPCKDLYQIEDAQARKELMQQNLFKELALLIRVSTNSTGNYGGDDGF